MKLIRNVLLIFLLVVGVAVARMTVAVVGGGGASVPAATVVNVYVDPGATGSNNGTSWANAYTSLQSAENDKDGDITAATGSNSIVIFHCKSSDGTADGVTQIAGWTTSATNYIKIQGGYAAAEAGTPGTPGNPGKYGTTFYHMEGTDNATGCLYINEDYVYVDKVLIQETVTGTGLGIYITGVSPTNNLTKITDCVVKGVVSGSGTVMGIDQADTDSNLIIANTLSYGFTGANTAYRNYSFTGTTTSVYNSISYNGYRGFYRIAGTVNIYNSVSFANTEDFTGTMTLAKCASDDNDAENVNGNEADATWSTDFADAANGDFTLLAGSPLIGAGQTGLDYGSPSINGVARGVAWDIGAWEYVAP